MPPHIPFIEEMSFTDMALHKKSYFPRTFCAKPCGNQCLNEQKNPPPDNLSESGSVTAGRARQRQLKNRYLIVAPANAATIGTYNASISLLTLLSPACMASRRF